MLKHKENQPRDNKTYQYPNQPHKTEKAITSNTHCLHTKIKMSSPPCAFIIVFTTDYYSIFYR